MEEMVGATVADLKSLVSTLPDDMPLYVCSDIDGRCDQVLRSCLPGVKEVTENLWGVMRSFKVLNMAGM